MSAPSTTRAYTLQDGKYELQKDVKVEAPGEYEIQVNVKAVSLNYRDIALKNGAYPFPAKTGVIPVSDGAGVVTAVGPKTHRFKVGDKVMPNFHPTWIGGTEIQPFDMTKSLGAADDGVLRDYINLKEEAFVKIPEGYSFVEAATLPCAALTAWDSLYGLEGRQLKPGQWVLTQGSGGVSVFAIQLAKAAGANVVATTSSAAKADRLRSLGADHVINYKSNPEWGSEARKLTPDGRGFHHIIEVGGPGTLNQSVKAIGRQGVISVIGFIAKGEAGSEGLPTMLDTLSLGCIVRGIFVSNRQRFDDLVAAINAKKFKPIVDKVFKFEDANEALKHMEGQNHFGKVVIEL